MGLPIILQVDRRILRLNNNSITFNTLNPFGNMIRVFELNVINTT